MAQEQSRLQKLGRQKMPVRHEHDMAPRHFTLVNSADVLQPKQQQNSAYLQGWLALKGATETAKTGRVQCSCGSHSLARSGLGRYCVLQH